MQLVAGRRASRHRRPRGCEVTGLLDAWVTDAGRGWVAALRTSLQAEGRKATGGWPGTLSEARFRTTAHCRRELDVVGHEPVSLGEIDRAARLLNRAARRAWLATAERERVEES